MTANHWLFRLFVRLRRFFDGDQFILAAIAVTLGVFVAFGEIAFRWALRFVQWAAFGSMTPRLASWAADLPWWHVVLAPTAGGLAIGLLLRYAMPDRRPQGVPHVIEACALKGGRMSLREGLAAAAVSAGSLGVGASTGREGPVVHLGATFGSLVADRLGLSPGGTRTLLGCGVAAAVACAFNAPIAGVFFALEVVVRHYALGAFAPVVLAAVAGTVVSRLHYGDFPAFILPIDEQIGSYLEFPAFALLGVLSAAAALGFMAAVVAAEAAVDRLAPPRLVRPAIGGLAVGVMALWLPEVLGVGYEAVDAALNEQLGLALMLALILAKIAACAISMGFGFGGGVFSPSLFVGAMVGGAFGHIATQVFPHLSSGHGAYALVGMGAVAAAVLGAPMSTILIVFEMTGDYRLTIAVMVAVVVASIITQQTLGKSLFTWQLERRGVDLKGGLEASFLSQIKASDVMRQDYTAIAADAGIDEVMAKLRKARFGEVLVMDRDGMLIGVITLADAAGATVDADLAATARSIARTDSAVLPTDADIRATMALIDRSGESHIPVVDSEADRRVVGMVHEHDVMLAYRRALEHARAEERGEEAPGTERTKPRRYYRRHRRGGR